MISQYQYVKYFPNLKRTRKKHEKLKNKHDHNFIPFICKSFHQLVLYIAEIQNKNKKNQPMLYIAEIQNKKKKKRKFHILILHWVNVCQGFFLMIEWKV